MRTLDLLESQHEAVSLLYWRNDEHLNTKSAPHFSKFLILVIWSLPWNAWAWVRNGRLQISLIINVDWIWGNWPSTMNTLLDSYPTTPDRRKATTQSSLPTPDSNNSKIPGSSILLNLDPSLLVSFALAIRYESLTYLFHLGPVTFPPMAHPN